MLYVLAYPEFAPSILEKIETFRLLHEPARAKLVSPHVTLVFGLKTASPTDVIARCETEAERLAEFHISFADTTTVFDPYERMHKLLLVCTEGRDQLTAIHENLYAGAYREEFNSDIPYVPHMTVATQQAKEDVASLDVGDMSDLPITAHVKALSVVEHLGERLKPLATVPLSRSE